MQVSLFIIFYYMKTFMGMNASPDRFVGLL